MARIHSHKNRIYVLIDNSGNSLSNQQDFENCFTSFFQDLWRSNCKWSFEDLTKALLPDHKTISTKDSIFLTKPVTYREILSTLKSMAKGKIPGPDGLNVEFYLFYRDIIKDHLYQAISHIFFFILPSFRARGVKITSCLFINLTTQRLFWIFDPYLYAMSLTKSFKKI